MIDFEASWSTSSQYDELDSALSDYRSIDEAEQAAQSFYGDNLYLHRLQLFAYPDDPSVESQSDANWEHERQHIEHQVQKLRQFTLSEALEDERVYREESLRSQAVSHEATR